MINQQGKERLLKLAEHLESGKLKHERFDFSTISNVVNGCFTNGCAIGELPIVFPEAWKYLTTDGECLSNGIVNVETEELFIHLTDWSKVYEFFSIVKEEGNVLFCPIASYLLHRDVDIEDDSLWEEGQDYLKINNIFFTGLAKHATKNNVAAHIRKFVKLKELEDEARSETTS